MLSEDGAHERDALCCAVATAQAERQNTLKRTRINPDHELGLGWPGTTTSFMPREEKQVGCQHAEAVSNRAMIGSRESICLKRRVFNVHTGKILVKKSTSLYRIQTTVFNGGRLKFDECLVFF